MKYVNFPMVPKVMYGSGSFSQLKDILPSKRSGGFFVFLIDDVFKNNSWITSRIPREQQDHVVFISASEEPRTEQVDTLVKQLSAVSDVLPSGILGIGGGTLMDLAKAVSIMLTNRGKTEEYQGWDLVKQPALYHIGIPTISGTGAEVSRTTVLTGSSKKLGINSDYTTFDQVILDPELTKDVPKEQWFYTGMDCYIHCIESLNGTYLNAFSESHGQKAFSLCKEVFLGDNLSEEASREKLMMASWHGGMSIGYSQVGIAHAMSYGLSYLLGIKHGIGNCMVFNHLESYYPEGVSLFKQMMDKHEIVLPKGVCSALSDTEFDEMIAIALSLEPLWENALGKDWRHIITPKALRAYYEKV